MAVLIDSSVFIEIERRGLGLDVLPRIARDPEAALSTVTASELLVGMYRADSPGRRRRREDFVEGVLTTIPAIPFDLTAARTHAQVTAQMRAMGATIGQFDSMIAATALTLELSVLTVNVGDFERVPGLIVQQPAWP